MVGNEGINAAEPGLNKSCPFWLFLAGTTPNTLLKQQLQKQTIFLLVDYLEGATDPREPHLIGGWPYCMFFLSSHRRAQGSLSEGSCPNLLSGHPFWGATGSRNPPILGKTLPSYQKSEVSFDHESRNTRWLVLDSKKGVCKRRPEGPFSPVLLNSEAHNKTPRSFGTH